MRQNVLEKMNAEVIDRLINDAHIINQIDPRYKNILRRKSLYPFH